MNQQIKTEETWVDLVRVYTNKWRPEEGEANAQRICDCVNALAGIENPQEFCDNRSVIINKLIEEKRAIETANIEQAERIKALELAGNELLQAMNQYSFFLNGYGNGSASISEVNHANDEVFKAQNVLFELLKTQ